MKKSINKKIITSALSTAVLFGALKQPISALADEFDALIGESDRKIEEINNAQSEAYTVLEAAYTAIQEVQEQAKEILEAVQEDNKAIEELEKEIAELEETIAKREELLAEQARSAQVQGGSTNYLTAIASAESISDFIGRIDVVRKMVSANKELINDQKVDVAAVEAKRDEVEEAKQVKVEKQVELENLKVELETKRDETEALYEQLSQDLTLAANERQELVAQKEAFEAQQAAYLAEQAAIAQAQAQAEAQAQAQAEYEAQVEHSEAVVYEEAAVEEQVAPVVEETVETAQVAEETAEAVYEEEALSEVAETVVEPEFVAEEAYEEAFEVEEVAPVEEVVEEPAFVEEEVVEEEVYEEPVVEEPVYEAPAYGSNFGDIEATAAKYLGTPYVWGGKNPGGFDCSGFAQYVFREAYGKEIGGYTGAQEHAGDKIGVSEAQAGDLIFWGDPGATYHVAIALGNGRYIHAVEPGKPLSYGQVSPYFQPSFAVRVR